MQNMCVRSIPIFQQIWILLKKIYFLGAQNTPFDARSAQTLYEILHPSLFSAHCASFMSKWSLLRGGCLHIHSLDRAISDSKEWTILEGCTYASFLMKNYINVFIILRLILKQMTCHLIPIQSEKIYNQKLFNVTIIFPHTGNPFSESCYITPNLDCNYTFSLI